MLGWPGPKACAMQKRSMPARKPGYMQQFTHLAQLARNRISSLKCIKILGWAGRKARTG